VVLTGSPLILKKNIMNENTTKIEKQTERKILVTELIDFITKNIKATTELHVENINYQGALYIENIEDRILKLFDKEDQRKKFYELKIQSKKNNWLYEIKNIKKIVSKYYRITVDEMLDKDRRRYKVWPRQVAMYFVYEKTKASLCVIGEDGFSRDHATVLHSIKIVNDIMETDKIKRAEIEELEKIISSVNIHEKFIIA
tara:strand:- start:93 stop:692 length:600 start_codon:yes stop_codon:yes gene_type:complete